MKPLIVISGPTATGKTALSVQLAKEIEGEIICADSMQIYLYMSIGSATPTLEERHGIMHHLFGIIHPKEQFSVAKYAELAHNVIAEVHDRGHIPILVGGTGLYIDTVVKNISLTKTQEDPKYRKQLYALSERMGKEYLHQMLALIDPKEAQRLVRMDTRRIIRALEIYKTMGITKTEQNRRSMLSPQIYRTLQFGIDYDRDILYERINKRVDIMMAEGLLSEVKSLLDMGVDRKMTAMQGIGYKELAEYFDQAISLDEAVNKIKQRTRNYAKRQLTWFRRNQDMVWLESAKQKEILKNCINIWKNFK